MLTDYYSGLAVARKKETQNINVVEDLIQVLDQKCVGCALNGMPVRRS